MPNQRLSAEELFGPPRDYEERKFLKKRRMNEQFSTYKIDLARKSVMKSDVYLKGCEDLQDVMPELLLRTAEELSAINGGNLGWRATLNGIKAITS